MGLDNMSKADAETPTKQQKRKQHVPDTNTLRRDTVARLCNFVLQLNDDRLPTWTIDVPTRHTMTHQKDGVTGVAALTATQQPRRILILPWTNNDWNKNKKT
jgi:hypothetical protein